MRALTRVKAAAILALLFGVTACADLEVANPNDPDAGRALANAGDVESLISGSFNTWFAATYSISGASPFLSNASFQHTAPWANFGMEFYGRIPRVGIVNDAADQFYGNFTWAWYRYYRSLAAVADGLRQIENNADLADELGADNVARARAYGKFVQGMAHAGLGLMYDQGFVVDETTDLTVPQTPVGYNALMEAAMGYFDDAIALSAGESFEIPAGWMTVAVPADQLARIAHSMKARYRAAVARTPDERAAVDWDAVIADVNAGVTANWDMDMNWDLGWYNSFIDYGNFPGWAQMNYFIAGMADQSGNYQRWLDLPLGEKLANPEGGPILIITPDLRYPQGSTVAEQQQNPGTEYIIPCRSDVEGYEACDISDSNIAGVWARPDRGTWRWSYYFSRRPLTYNFGTSTVWTEIPIAEMNLLEAEGLLRNGDPGAAATLVNITRTAAGLNATDAAGTNTSCVPKLPNGDCGDLMEMLKWEKRHETRMRGLNGVPWYFEGRGWGDLYEGTPLQFPAPCRELQLLDMLPCYSFGGDGDFASPGSIYAIESAL